MNARNFARGVGVGMVAGSALSMSISAANKKNGNQRKTSKVLRTMGSVVENIGNSFKM